MASLFAIIMRYQTYKFDEEKQLFSDVLTGEFLLVKGLTGYERIDGKIGRANGEKIRMSKPEKIADAGYVKNR